MAAGQTRAAGDRRAGRLWSSAQQDGPRRACGRQVAVMAIVILAAGELRLGVLGIVILAVGARLFA